MSERIKKSVSWFVYLFTPVLLLITAIRFLMLPAFVDFEYNLPNFPADPYGLTKAQRLELAPIALDYLLNDEGISFLGDLTLDDGSPVYNARELKHMEDVKNLTQSGKVFWQMLWVIYIGVGIWFWRTGDWSKFASAVSRGGLLTIWVILGLMVFILLSFDFIFVGFHRIFFEGDTWMFRYDDTLIRLFPLKFWQDVFIDMGLIALLEGILVWRVIRPKP